MTKKRDGWVVLAPGSRSAHLEGEEGWGLTQGELAADPRRLLVPLLLAEPGALLLDRTDDVSDLSSPPRLLSEYNQQ